MSVESLAPYTWRSEVEAIHERVVKWPAWSQEDQQYLALALCGEVGELANLLKKRWRGDFGVGMPADAAVRFVRDVRAELADIMIYLYLLATACAVDLDEVCEEKLPELRRRWPESLPV